MDIAKLAKELSLTKDQREALAKYAIDKAIEEAKPEWLPTSDVLLKFKGSEVGAKGISSDVLEGRVKSGEFQYGVHYMNALDSVKGVKGFYLWNYEAIKELWKIPPEQRTRTQSMARSGKRVLKIA